MIVIAFVILALLAASAIVLYRRRDRRLGEPLLSDALDERDKVILSLLEERGEMTAAEISEASGIPKSPLYRRLKRLVEEGYIEARRAAGKTVYRLRRKP